MHIETRTTDAKGRLVLPKAFANATVIIEQVSDTELRVRRAKVIAEDELALTGESAAPSRTATATAFCRCLQILRPRRRPSRRPPLATRLAVADWIIEPFGQAHDRSAFACGKPSLDDFIHTRVSQYEKRRLGKTFVAVPEGEKRVIGYYTLAAGAVTFKHLPTEVSRKLPKHPIRAFSSPVWPSISRPRASGWEKDCCSTPFNVCSVCPKT